MTGTKKRVGRVGREGRLPTQETGLRPRDRGGRYRDAEMMVVGPREGGVGCTSPARFKSKAAEREVGIPPSRVGVGGVGLWL